MKNKQIQEQRIKGYFIQATKDILKGEGLKSISVRNIADQAGYSYATLYNYFSDVNELVFECVKDFQQECETIIQQEVINEAQGIDRIKAISRAYVKYFVQYPGIFELFFLEKPAKGQEETLQLINTFFDRLCLADWQYCISKTMVPLRSVEVVKQQLNYMLTGMLLFYLNRRHPIDYAAMLQNLDVQLLHILS